MIVVFAGAPCCGNLHTNVRQPASLLLCSAGKWASRRSGFMNKLAEIRSQEHMCRERAALHSERRMFWLAQAEEWEQRALDEIAYHFRECNLGSVGSQFSMAH